jgi:quinolinate synthase
MSTADILFDKLQHVTTAGPGCVYSRERCAELAPFVDAINELKKRRKAIILAHSYVNPEIVYGVADHSGDSYQLAKIAKASDAEVIVFVAVRFMGETAKILNPGKTVLIPSEPDGCSLADSITGADVRKLKAQHPGVPVLCYINTSAEVKAECDVCVTSSNVYDIVAKIPSRQIIFVPDKLMGKNVQEEMDRRGLDKELILWDGTCYVHEEYDPEMVRTLRDRHPGLQVMAHPECSPGILHLSDFVGSTSQLLKQMEKVDAPAYLMLTECGLSARLQVEMPQKQFVGTCSMCKYMKANNLADILRVLSEPKTRDFVEIPEELRVKALACIERMFDYVG